MQKIRGILALLMGALMLVLGGDHLLKDITSTGVIMVVLGVGILVCGVLELRCYDWRAFRRRA